MEVDREMYPGFSLQLVHLLYFEGATSKGDKPSVILDFFHTYGHDRYRRTELL